MGDWCRGGARRCARPTPANPIEEGVGRSRWGIEGPLTPCVCVPISSPFPHYLGSNQARLPSLPAAWRASNLSSAKCLHLSL